VSSELAVSLARGRVVSPRAAPAEYGLRRAAGIALLVCAAVAAINVSSPRALGVLLALAIAVPLIWRAPVMGLYILLGAAVTIESGTLGFPDSLTDRVPLFEGLNNSLNLGGISMNPVEILIALVLVRAVSSATPQIRKRLVTGKLFVPYLLFLSTVLFGEVHGLLASGDFNKSLWEIRPQVYGFLAFVVASLLVRSRRDLEMLTLVVLVCVVLKAVIGDVRYFLVMGRQLGAHDGVLGHEDSYFLGLALIGLLAALIWTRRAAGFKLLLFASPLVLAALLVNQRRAGILALAGGLVTLTVLAIRFHPHLQRRIAVFAVIAALLTVGFLAIFWNQQSGIVGQLVRPVRSQFDPSYRDYLSDLYRQAENANLKLSFDTDRLLGMGFGMPFLTVYTQADISNNYPLWNYIPHNTLLWVGVRMGFVGLVTFWGLFTAAFLEICYLLRGRLDPFLMALVSVAGAALVSELLVAYGDLQLESYRNIIFVGALFGILNVLPTITKVVEPKPRRSLV